MNSSVVEKKLKEILPISNILVNEPMKNHTSFKIGGPADFIVMPQNEEQISKVVKELSDIPIFVVGNGSNLLVSDNGIRGIVIKTNPNMSKIKQIENQLVCQSGALLSKIATFALRFGLGGFEFAAGIPGTLGGAVVMNAGAYGGEMKDVVVSTRYVDNLGDIHEVTNHDFGYRSSFFSNTKAIATQSALLLYQKDKDKIRAKMADLSARRRQKQPLEYCSAGSTFKRPKGHFAGKLIENAGLSGYRIGGATVSAKHCGFIINDANATFDDVMRLIEYVQSEVYKKFGVHLDTEVKICGL
ncbi:MAG: UDP-N-acetylmuramate dehydrogenase [Firmicutes bacterium]|nr:UDP-N-acetylmuramate dehydrogenase [Bacillota bacterium]